MTDNFEYYPTPDPFTHWLFEEVQIHGRVFEPCVGDGAIQRATWPPNMRRWFSNDLDPRWPADAHKDATDETLWAAHEFDWTVTNPPFSIAVDLVNLAVKHSKVGVAMHLRASIHEVLKKDSQRRTWLAERPPTGILWLPRFGYQRSKDTGKWATDSVCACWCIWLKDPAAPQFIRYAPERVLDELDAFTPAYRARMDALMLERDPEGYGALLELGRPKKRQKKSSAAPELSFSEVSI